MHNALGEPPFCNEKRRDIIETLYHRFFPRAEDQPILVDKLEIFQCLFEHRNGFSTSC